MMIIRSPRTREDFKAYYELRFQVLRAPWGQARGTEKDDYEPISRHFMGVDEKTGAVMAVGKLFEKEPGVAWMSHLAVDPQQQQKGLGTQLMKHIEDEARKQGYTRIGVQARLNTTKYFEKAGYVMKGLPAHYFGTTQVVWMEKPL
jgi:N-acetylglutamate synthase-like GNAT family acetyltransferase